MTRFDWTVLILYLLLEALLFYSFFVGSVGALLFTPLLVLVAGTEVFISADGFNFLGFLYALISFLALLALILSPYFVIRFYRRARVIRSKVVSILFAAPPLILLVAALVLLYFALTDTSCWGC